MRGCNVFQAVERLEATLRLSRLARLRPEPLDEINRLERDGCDLVGMTGMPEAVLARELGLPYAAISVVANHAAGRGSSANGIRFESLDSVLQEAMGRVRAVIEELVGRRSGRSPSEIPG